MKDSSLRKNFSDKLKELSEEIIYGMEQGIIEDKRSIEKLKKKWCRENGITTMPTNAQILMHIPDERKKELKGLLQKKPVRTLSGVAVVAVMTDPHPCPHGRCIPCPGGPPFSAQSYTGREPAAQRASMNNYDPFMQTNDRIKQLEVVGHTADKIELIIMGGTFTARDFYYQEWFAKRCYDAMNGKVSKSLEDAKILNEKATHRCVGLTVETRPDWFRLQHVDRALEIGATRVELGAQILNDSVLYEMGRGHTASDTADATRIARDSGLKVCYHIMPGLPGSDREKDIESFKRMFSDSNFMPDMLKIYPTLVVKPSLLYQKWKKGGYKPLDTEEAVEIISEMKKYVPEWVRIQRVERDIPSNLIDAGVKKSNLRQLVHLKMEKEGNKCRCIRCREVGHREYKDKLKIEEVEMVRREYEAGGGKEIFLSFEDTKNDTIVGYCRLRFPALPHRPEIGDNDAVVRELRVSGSIVPIGEKADGEWQHRGYGRKLLREAEEIAREAGKEKILVLSGIGVREYYKKLGYERDGVYMSKKLDQENSVR